MRKSLKPVTPEFVERGVKGEIDLVGYDGKTLAFVEVRTRSVRENLSGLPELSVTRENNMWWFAPRSDFWRSARWVNVHAVRRDGNR
jgi:Holliday junction resolvase-like predicted endonuclease